MQKEQLIPGTRVSWLLRDGNIMAGEVNHAAFYPSVAVTRIDGTLCTVQADKLRTTVYEDIVAAVDFYARIPNA